MNLYKQYSEVKKQHPDALVFFRVGDFYEMYGQDAIKASELLDLTLTGRDFGLPERVSMCGVPCHAADSYISKLAKDGIKVVICEPSAAVVSAPQAVTQTEQMPAAAILPASQDNTNTPIQQAKREITLAAVNMEQKVLKDHLEANASEALAEKINNGVKIVKDGKAIINKKDLTTFMNYAYEEAKKQAEKGARFSCVEYKTVFNWLMHYFEEDSITGTLYNEDGTQYNPPRPVVKGKTSTGMPVSVSPLKATPKPQLSLFDLIDVKPDAREQAAEVTEYDEPEGFEDADAEPAEMQDDGTNEGPELRQIGENRYVDSDGIVYETSETAKPETVKSVIPVPINTVTLVSVKHINPVTATVIPDALIRLFGDVLIAG